MQSAQTYLEVVRGRGERHLELKRVYHNLRNRSLPECVCQAVRQSMAR